MVALVTASVTGPGSASAAGPVALAPTSAPSSPSGPETPTRRGVLTVAAAGTPSSVAWPVAQALSEDADLRAKIDEPLARVLAGDAPGEGASGQARELWELRGQIKGDDAASRVLLAEVGRRTAARAIALVLVVEGAAEVRIWDAATDTLESTRHRREGSGWSPLVGAVRARVLPRPDPAPKPTPAAPKSTLQSPWFWGAIGAAVLAGVVAYAASQSGSAPAAVLVRW